MYKHFMENAVNHSQHPVDLIRDEYISRRKANASYSLTAFARDLGLSVSFLSRLLRGERSITVNQTIQISTILRLSTEQMDSCIEALIARSGPHSKISKKFIHALEKKKKTDTASKNEISFFEVERFRVISDWYHLAILNLTKVKSFNPDKSDIAKRLGITRVEVEAALTRLENLGLLKKRGDSYERTLASLYIKTLKSDRAIREFTKQTLVKAAHALDNSTEDAFAIRCMPCTTLPIDSRMLPELKALILKFQLDFANRAKSSECDEVYQFNVQMFPLTQTKNQSKIKIEKKEKSRHENK